MRHTKRSHEAGIALVLALLSLMLLTFLGLTLAATTSTELQIANNYRWSQQAFYNAEAGIEVGKKVLATVDWSTLTYVARNTPWNGATLPTTAADGSVPSPASRNYENWQCDRHGFGAGYGRVLVAAGVSYSDVQSYQNQPVNGAFTLWVRRPAVEQNDGTIIDDNTNTNLILVSEGIAPFSDAAGLGTNLGAQTRAARTMEIQVTSVLTTTACGTLSGQAGGGPEGANFGGCIPVSAASVGRSLGLAGAPGDPTGAPAENKTAR